MASKNSAIWTFFDQVENEPKFAKCKFCGDKLSLGSENSKNQEIQKMLRNFSLFVKICQKLSFSINCNCQSKHILVRQACQCAIKVIKKVLERIILKV